MSRCIHREGSTVCGDGPAFGIVIPPEQLNAPGRPAVHGGPYCHEHGGAERSWRDVRVDWNYLAPAAVGDGEAVVEAGKLHLDTTNAYVVIRRGNGGTWLAWLGVGSKQVQVRRPDRLDRELGEKGACSFDTEEEALHAATRQWETRLLATIATIKAARGGTLAWGERIEPLSFPTVLRPTDGESTWQAARAAPVRSMVPPGNTGLRPTGEAL